MPASKKTQFIQTTQRLDDGAMEDAPEGEWIANVQNSVNLLNDAVSNSARRAGASLVASGQMEIKTLKVTVPDPFRTVSDADMTNGWVNYSSIPFRYAKHAGGLVELHLLLKDGVIGSAAFILPAPFRPAYDITVPAVSAGAFGAVFIGANGEVNPSVGSNASIGIDITYSAKDSSPIVQACWPKPVVTNIPHVVDVQLANVEDGTSNGKNVPGAGMSVSWQNSIGDKGRSVLINNIIGLPYNRTSIVTLVLLGG